MDSKTMETKKETYLLLALMESLDKRLAESLRPIVENDPTNPEIAQAMKHLFRAKLPTFQIERYLSTCSNHKH